LEGGEEGEEEGLIVGAERADGESWEGDGEEDGRIVGTDDADDESSSLSSESESPPLPGIWGERISAASAGGMVWPGR